MKNILITSLFITGLLFSCKTKKESSTAQKETNIKTIVKKNTEILSLKNDLEGAYIISYIDGFDELNEGIVSPTIVIDASGNVSGNNGCNSYFGTINLEEDSKKIENLGSTRMLCRGIKNGIETRLMELLREVNDIKIDGQTLLLFINGQEAIRAQKSNLEGEWKVQNIGNSIVFSVNESQIEGNTGCNNFSVQMKKNRFELTLNDIVYTEMECDIIDSKKETKFLNSLETVTNYQIKKNIALFYSNDEVLFTAVREE